MRHLVFLYTLTLMGVLYEFVFYECGPVGGYGPKFGCSGGGEQRPGGRWLVVVAAQWGEERMPGGRWLEMGEWRS